MSSPGFGELVLLFIIGLLILGPERLPRVASQLGRWVGRARRTANQLRYQLEREVALADIKKPPKKPPTEPSSKPSDGDANDIGGGISADAGDEASPPGPASQSGSSTEETVAGTAAASEPTDAPADDEPERKS